MVHSNRPGEEQRRTKKNKEEQRRGGKVELLPARNGRAVVGGALDGRTANIDATLHVHAGTIAALTLETETVNWISDSESSCEVMETVRYLHEGFAFFGAGQGDQRVAAVVRALLGRTCYHVRTAHHVILTSSKQQQQLEINHPFSVHSNFYLIVHFRSSMASENPFSEGKRFLRKKSISRKGSDFSEGKRFLGREAISRKGGDFSEGRRFLGSDGPYEWRLTWRAMPHPTR